MERSGHRPPVHAAQPARLRDLGYDERWLQDWLAADPTRLGLGQVVVLAQELTHAHGGSLDILAADGDTYYSIEVQLGEVDASHGFRVLDYWARNRSRSPDKTHVAVLLVESADGRFRQANPISSTSACPPSPGARPAPSSACSASPSARRDAPTTSLCATTTGGGHPRRFTRPARGSGRRGCGGWRRS
jgi:hypothetical protein